MKFIISENRIDDLVMFNSLSREDIHKIIDIELKDLFKRIHGLGYDIKISEEAKDYISERGYDENFGARHLKRAIQKHIEDPLAEEIINSSLQEGDSINITFDTDKKEISIKITKPKKKKKSTED